MKARKSRNLAGLFLAVLGCCFPVMPVVAQTSNDEKLLEEHQIPGVSLQTTKASPINFAELAKRHPFKEGDVKDNEEEEIKGEGNVLPIPETPAAPFNPETHREHLNLLDREFLRHNRLLIASPAPSASFQAVPDNNTSIPPDTHGSVGPNHLMTVLNTQIRIQNKTGTTLSTVSLESFWTGVGPGGVFDPKVLYDPYRSRWIFVACAAGGSANSALLVAVSQTNDPTGTWNRFSFDYDSTNVAWADYPSIGFNKDWIAVSLNSFANSNNAFIDARTYIIDKVQAYAGTASATVHNYGNSQGATHAPALTYDNTSTSLYLVARWNSGSGQVRLFRIDNSPPTAPVLTALALFPSTSGWTANSVTDFATQSGSASGIMNNDDRIQNVVYRNTSLWVAHTIFLPTGTPTRSAVQWWQINPTSGAVTQVGKIEDTTPPNILGGTAVNFYAFPSIAVNADNDVLIGYSRFSSQQFASSNYSFRSNSDTPNTLRDDAVLKAGEACYRKTFGGGRNRWGDYSFTSVDPADGKSLWTIQQYATPSSDGTCNDGTGRWATWWGKIPASVPTAATVSVRGKVLRSNNLPLKGVIIQLTSLETSEVFTAKTDGRGQYIVEDIPAGRSYVLRPVRKGFNFAPKDKIINLVGVLEDENFIGTQEN